ncbi:MAG TPA: LarC family nickel insertion protein [Usitatibacter sp.]|nr:LarC family nickel insertion protein [Usitatibacter sp.]
MSDRRLARIHLDPVGGIAGDMFVAAMAAAFPAAVPGLWKELRRLKPPSALGKGIRLVPHRDTSLNGLRFLVDAPPGPSHHTPHRQLREQLSAAGLEPDVLRHTLALFQTLAEAEGRVHHIAPENVEFHEVGAWDSIVDFVAAGYFIATLAPEEWTLGPLPLGGGRVHTAHGVMPVPAPATAILLQGLPVIDDGVMGERVTPTGAAIVRYLVGKTGDRHFSPPTGAERPAAGKKCLSAVFPAAAGHGFGTLTLPGIPNMLRVLAFEHADSEAPRGDEEIATLQFEVDDQAAEDLATALERIRGVPGVLEVYQLAAYGKKGRLATQVQVLARLEAADAAADACLQQTTTLGLRVARVWRRTLLRETVEVRVPEKVRVKTATRPSAGVTAKAEMDDIARSAQNRVERDDLRERAESAALQLQPEDIDAAHRKDD